MGATCGATAPTRVAAAPNAVAPSATAARHTDIWWEDVAYGNLVPLLSEAHSRKLWATFRRPGSGEALGTVLILRTAETEADLKANPLTLNGAGSIFWEFLDPSDSFCEKWCNVREGDGVPLLLEVHARPELWATWDSHRKLVLVVKTRAAEKSLQLQPLSFNSAGGIFWEWISIADARRLDEVALAAK